MTGLIPRFCPHCSGPLDVTRILQWGGWTYDEESRMLAPEGEHRLHLTPTEGDLLGALLRANGRPVSRAGGLYAAACGDRPEVDWPEIKIIDVYISKLRRKLEQVYRDRVLIGTQRAIGYYAVPYGIRVERLRG